MPIAYIVSWFVGVSCLSLLIRGFKNQSTLPGQKPWIFKSGLLLITTIALELFLPEAGGFISLVLWGILIILPPTLRSRIQGALIEVNFKKAAGLAFVARGLHPFGDYLSLPAQVNRIREIAGGSAKNLSQLTDELRTQAQIPTLYQSLPAVLAAQGRWEEITRFWPQFLESQWGSLSHSNQLAGLSIYLRALGEVGRVRDLVVHFFDHGAELEKAGPAAYLTGLLFVAAFAGREKFVEKLCQREDLNLKIPNKLFWRATALQASGGGLEAADMLQKLKTSLNSGSDQRLLHWTNDRLANGVPIGASQLTPEEFRFLDRLEMDALPVAAAPATSRRRTMANSFGPNFQPRITYVIGAVIVFFYGVEIYFGGAESNEGLFAAGALHTFEVIAESDWWRLLAATFVHAGPVHLGMNLLGLYFVGPFVEFSLGKFRYLVVYLFAGVMSTISVTLLANLGFIQHQFLVGASGAIMGLIGATGAIALRSWLKDRSHFAISQLRAVGFAMVIQIAFDLSTPRVSSTAHMSGAVAGFLVTLLLYRSPPRRS